MEDDDGCDETSLEHEKRKCKPSVVKVAAAVQAQKNALTSPGKVKEPYQTTKSEDNIPVLLSQTVSRKVDGCSFQLTTKEKSALVSRDVVFDQRLDLSKDEQNQFEEYDPTSDNPRLTLVLSFGFTVYVPHLK